MKPRFSGPAPVVPFLSWVPLVLATPLTCPSLLADHQVVAAATTASKDLQLVIRAHLQYVSPCHWYGLGMFGGPLIEHSFFKPCFFHWDGLGTLKKDWLQHFDML